MSRLRSGIRSRFTPGRILLAGALIAAFLALFAAFEGQGSGVAVDHAARLAPADAVIYLHARIDRESGQWKHATRLIKRFPGLFRLENRLLRGLTPGGRRLDFEREVYPWLGDEAALALVPDRHGSARSLILLEVSDRQLASSFLSRAVGRVRTSGYRGVRIRAYGRLATAFLGDFLAIGQPANLRAAVDASQGRARSLVRDPVFNRARHDLPDRDQLLFAYASRSGVRNVLRQRSGLVGRLTALADDSRLEGIAGTLSAEKRGARLSFTSALKPSTGPNPKSFKPDLLKAVSGDAIAYIGMQGADRIFESIASFAGSASLPLPTEVRRLRSDLVGARGRGALRKLEPLLQKEAALFVSRSGVVPVVTLVVDHVSGRDADEFLRHVQPLLTRLLRRPSAVGQVPTLQPLRIAGVNAASLRISPALELTYATFGGRIVVTTSPGGIRRVKLAKSRILDNPLFAPGMRGDLDHVSSVLFLDLEQLLALGERAGLGDTPGYQALKSDLSPVRAVSAVSQVKAASKTAEIFIEVQ
jgi:hypothetical protein